MTTMFDRIAKSRLLRNMDHISKFRSNYDKATVLQALQTTSIPEFCFNHKVAIDAVDRKHIEDHWMPAGSDAWFINPDNVDILRAAFREVIAKMFDHDLPIDAYWVCFPDDVATKDRAIEVYHSVNDRQITVLILTPSPPPATGNKTEPSMFVTRKEGGAVSTRPVKI